MSCTVVYHTAIPYSCDALPWCVAMILGRGMEYLCVYSRIYCIFMHIHSLNATIKTLHFIFIYVQVYKNNIFI